MWSALARTVLALPALVLPLLAFAGAPEEPPPDPGVHEAERVRLSQDVKQLAQREAWAGVERKFQELQALGLPLTYDDLYRGACAARALGDAQSAYHRLRAASAIEPRKEVVDWLYTIDTHYGEVVLVATPPRNATLAIREVPFDPAERAAAVYAAGRVARDGTFAGLLPRGHYVFAGHAFSVEPGVSQHIEVNTRGRRAAEGTDATTEDPREVQGRD